METSAATNNQQPQGPNQNLGPEPPSWEELGLSGNQFAVGAAREIEQPEPGELARYQKTFEPLIRPESEVESPGYDHLFSDDPEIKAAADAYYAAQDEVRPKQERHDKFVTPETRAGAAENLTQALVADKKMREIVASFADRIDLRDPLKVVDSLRTDPEIRLAVGVYLVGKVNRVAETQAERMPDRVLDNSRKAVSGLAAEKVSHLSSREYVALLCLARLDGSFNESRADAVEYDSRGRAKLGQHRAVADIVLGESGA